MKEKIRIFKTENLLFITGDDVYKTTFIKSNYVEDDFKKGYAYMVDGYVVPFRGATRDKSDLEEVGIYSYMATGSSESKIVITLPVSKEDKITYSLDAVVEADTEAMFKDMIENKENLVSLQESRLLKDSAEVFLPEIYPEDDFLKKAIKKVLHKKRINIGAPYYKGFFKDKWLLSNMLMGMKQGSTALSIKYVCYWCEILNIDLTITQEDNVLDKTHPMKTPVIMSQALEITEQGEL